ncbi:MAG: Uma2 family endonuclease [Kiritimatiellae bacterium]|nr:Uma2 family endonuclease [Kiritimatiellia bacterium]
MAESRHGAKGGPYTWSDYRRWPRDERWEIVAGESYAMTPAPSTRHQQVVGEVFAQLHGHFAGKSCRAFVSPMDVRLTEQDVVQPDVLVVCAPDRVRRSHIEGAPTLVVEVVSPSSALHDHVRKMALYARAGVQEVWLVTPYPWLAEVFALDGATYRLAGSYTKEDTLESPTFPDLRIELAAVFDFRIEPGEEISLIKEGRPRYAAEGSK